jgi:mannonate dehydratase
MAAVHLDLASWSFGIQEENDFQPEEKEMFPGHAVLERGYLYANDGPGLGIDIDEDKARSLLDVKRITPRSMPVDRRVDGAVVRP